MSLLSVVRGALGAPDGAAVDHGRRVILFGDSHVEAIQQAISRRAEMGRKVGIDARRLLKLKEKPSENAEASDKPGAPWLSRLWKRHFGRRSTMGDTTFDEFLVIARSLRASDVVISVIGGNQHAVVGTIQHPKPLDFVVPGEEVRPLDNTAEIIPYRTIYAYFLGGIRERDGKALAALRAATVARIVHLQSPPPKASNGFITKRHDTQFAAQGISDFGVSNPELRLKFWRLQNAALEELCAELDIELLPPPPAAVHPKGYLDRPFYARDATHANVEYGDLVVSQLEAHLNLAPGAAASGSPREYAHSG